MEVTTTITNVLSRETISDKIGDCLIKRCMSIPQLLKEFEAFIQREIYKCSSKDKYYCERLLKEIESWNLDEEENVE